MDQTRSRGSSEVLDPVHEQVDENLSISVERVAIDAVDGGKLGEGASLSGAQRTSEDMGKDLGSNMELKEGPKEINGRDKRDQQKITDALIGVDQGTSYNSKNSVNQEALETMVVIGSIQTEYVNGDNRKLEAKVNETGLSKVKGASETDKISCMIDIKGSSCKELSENLEGERICRICHLSSGQPSDTTAIGIANSATSAELIQLGCACKDELGIAHSHCAGAWFKLKGNRLCEICGETAKNVSGVSDNGFMQEWNERGFMDDGSSSSHRFGGCWRGQPFCNFLMACLVIAFVLPWFFRVNMF